MLYTTGPGKMWDPTIIRTKGMYYMFTMYNGGDANFGHRGGRWDKIRVARSADGVHWEDAGNAIESDGLVLKPFVLERKGGYTMNFGSVSGIRGRVNDVLKFYVSDDLENWHFAYEKSPDPRWYKEEGRADHMYMIPKVPGSDEHGYWGYVVATTNEAWPYKSTGMMSSPDGVEWTHEPPVAIDWGDVPQQFMEEGGCEFVDGRYYLIMGARFGYMGIGGYSMFTFVSDSPTGPFKPDLEAFRLCGNSKYFGLDAPPTREIGVQFLACFVKGTEGETLISTSLASHKNCNGDLWLTPMKRAVTDGAGHLRLAWWRGNEALKGRRLPVRPEQAEMIWPRQTNDRQQCCISTEKIMLDDGIRHFLPGAAGGMIAMLPEKFDLDKGLVLTGRMRLRDQRYGIDTHMLTYTAGIFIEEMPSKGRALLMESYGLTKIADVDISGDKMTFDIQDVTGPGCATKGGILTDLEHSFRLLVRLDMMEFYLDDMLVQSFFLPAGLTGRIGFIVSDALCEFWDIEAWDMSL